MPSHRALTLSLVVLSLLSACAPVEPTVAPPARTFAAPLPSPTPTSIPAPAPTPTAGTDCHARSGQLVAHEIKLPKDTRPLAYIVYLPPCYDPARDAPYPILYLMHGLAQSETEWVDLGVSAAADALIAAGTGPEFVIVMPGERTGYDMLSAVTTSLLPYLERTMPVGGRPELRAIGGLSRGAGWALRIGLQRPDLFASIGLHSPAVISPDLYLLPTWAADVASDPIPRLWIDVGSDDTLLPAAHDLRTKLDELRWPYTWVQNSGEHTATYWSAHLPEYLRWYALAWPAAGPDQ